MPFFSLFPFSVLLFLLPLSLSSITELNSLLALKSSLDPSNTHLTSWTKLGDPCQDGSFEGVGCNHLRQVANISLQGLGLVGQLSPAIAGLKHLTGLYLHYNSLSGEIPVDIGSLSELVDLYLDVNNLSGKIPPQIGNMQNLQVLQLGYNKLIGSIPTQLGSLKKLAVFAVQSNQLSGAIPASLGEIPTLGRLDLSFNQLFGSIPTRLADAPLLQSLDLRNNSLSGNVPPFLRRLKEGFQYENNPGLCGTGFMALRACTESNPTSQVRPEPFAGTTTKDIPETANVLPKCNRTRCPNATPKNPHAPAAVGAVIVITIALLCIGIFTLTRHRCRKQKLGSSMQMPDGCLSADRQTGLCGKNGSPLISLEYPNGWDPLSDNRSLSSEFSQEVIRGFRMNLEEIECATQHFSPANMLGKCGLSAVYKGVLRDGSVVAVKRMSKSSCKAEEAVFLKGLNVLTALKHKNLVRLRGFCCSRGRGECFLVHDFVPNGNLLRYLDLEDGDANVLEWSTRVRIIHGIAKGIQYLHSPMVNKPPLVHQNISAEKVLVDHQFNPLLSGSGLHKLLTNDMVFSALKASAAMGYLAPEYTTTGRFNDKSDIYSFGVLVLQILSGKKKITQAIRLGAESLIYPDFVDQNLHGQISEHEAATLAKMALACTNECPFERPDINAVVQELGNCSINSYRSP